MGIFKKIGHALESAWRWLSGAGKKAVSAAVQLTEKAKEWDHNNPLALDILTTIIPGDWDDKLKDKIRAALPGIMIKARLVDAVFAEGLSPKEIVEAGVKVLNSFEGLQKKIFLNSFSQFVTDAMADGKIDWDDLAHMPKWWYDHDADPDIDTSVPEDDN